MDIGLIWDKYDSRLKAQVLKDLLELTSVGLTRVQVIAPIGEDTGWLDQQLKMIGIKRVDSLLPTQWRCYVLEQEPVMPDCCDDWMVKDLRIQKSRGVPMRPNSEGYPSLERQSDNRVVPPGLSLTINKMPPIRPNGNNLSVQLPQNFWYSPFI
jgi:hypothetical protein